MSLNEVQLSDNRNEIIGELEQDGKSSARATSIASSTTSRASALRNVVPPDADELAVEGVAIGAQEFAKLSWSKLSIVLITETIALGALSLPSSFASLGMAASVILCLSFGFISIYAADMIGQTCVAYPNVRDYPEVCQVMGNNFGALGGKIGYIACGILFIIYQTLTVGSHSLTGGSALSTIAQKDSLCYLLWTAISSIVLFAMGLPKTFSDMSFLGWIDFASIMAAIIITMIATGIEAGGAGSDWTADAMSDLSFSDAMVAVTTITFAFSFAASQPSFMSEMSNPRDYRKSIITLGCVETTLYTVVGATIYTFKGPNVADDALESSSLLIQRIAFGIALPVIYISGAINTTAGARFVYKMIFDGTEHEFIDTTFGLTCWVAIVFLLTILGWVVAEVIPFFSDLLSVISALCSSAYTFWLPGLMWLLLLRKRYTNPAACYPGAQYTDGYSESGLIAGEDSEDKGGAPNSVYYSIPPDSAIPAPGWHVLCHDCGCVLNLTIGAFLTVAGLYSAIQSILDEYQNGTVSGVFSCQG